MELQVQKISNSNQTAIQRVNLTKMFGRKQELTVGIIVNAVWVSTFLALILTVPSLVIFVGIYFSTGNILLGVVIGFGLHFVGLVYSERTSKGLLRMMS